MTYDPNIDSGLVHTKSWVQIPNSVFNAIEQGTDLDGAEGNARAARNYAQLVSVVGSSVGSVSGSIPISDISELYATHSVILGNYTWVGQASVGSDSGDAVWRCKEIYNDGALYTVKWADGNTNFDNIADNIASLTYI